MVGRLSKFSPNTQAHLRYVPVAIDPVGTPASHAPEQAHRFVEANSLGRSGSALGKFSDVHGISQQGSGEDTEFASPSRGI